MLSIKMKRWIIYGAFSLLLFPNRGTAQQRTWSAVELDAPEVGVAYFSLERSSLDALLSKAGTERNTGVEIEMPHPDGTVGSFIVWENTLLPARLKSKFPEIRTYSGVSVDDPRHSLKLEKTALGWYSMVFDEHITYYITPDPSGVALRYQVARKTDFPGTMGFACETQGELAEETDIVDGEPLRLRGRNSGQITGTANGNVRRVYRLALACTGEYAEAVAGPNPTVSNVLSAMAVTMNRVNGIYERELGISFQLVDNNDTLIFLDNSDDPYSNFSAGAMLSQNQNTLGDRIGSSNYDIGHVFSTGGGGLAILGSTCNFFSKAKGVTGMGNPVGDPFAVDYVAHEIGHQMGANHTFNACGGNTNMNTAFEPGSGSTIMGYAGICGANNLQQHSDAYFHSASLNEIVNFIETDGSCAVENPGGPAIPPDTPIAMSFKIPAQTPFELEGPVGGVSASDSLLYNWEQRDLGNLNAQEANSAHFIDGPTFRSFSPAISRSRVFPGLDNILSNTTSVKGERLPVESRMLNFQYTIRNIENGFGAFRTLYDRVTIEVVNTGTPFEITYPNNAGLGFASGASIDITWNVAGTDQTPINCNQVDIYLSEDGGHTFPYLLANGIANTGNTTAVLPNLVTAQARIKIKSSDNIFFDINNQDFAIGSATVRTAQNESQALQLYPNPGRAEVQLSHTGAEERALVTIVDLSGKIIWTGPVGRQHTLNTSNWTRGLYLVKLTQNGASATEKLVLY